MLTVYGHYSGYGKRATGAWPAPGRAHAAGVCRYLFPVGRDLSRHPHCRIADSTVVYRGAAVFYRRRSALCVHAPARPAWSVRGTVAQHRGDCLVRVCRYLRSAVLGGAIRAVRNHLGAGSDAAAYDHRLRGVYLPPATVSLADAGCGAVGILRCRVAADKEW